MKDEQVLYWSQIFFSLNSFTGNELREKLKLNSNQIHLQLFNISKKSKHLNRFVRENQTYYYIEL